MNRYDRLKEAIEAERAQEEQYYNSLAKTKSIQERLDSGLMWWPVQINKRHYTVGEFVEVELERTKMLGNSHRMKVGNGVKIFKEGRDDIYTGVISFMRRDKLRVIIKDDRFMHDNDIGYGLIGVELVYDERPYKIMKQTIDNLLSSSDPKIVNLRNDVAEGRSLNGLSDYVVRKDQISSRLNASQINAIHEISKCGQLGVIHGPPGTGKTTTLVEMLVQLAKREKKILVSAPSNNAVDLLAKMLDDRNVPVIRVGNISRISDDLTHLSINEKMRNHSDWKHIKRVRIEADEARRLAGQFKRNFGSTQRQDRSAMYKEAKELKKWARELEDRLTDVILNDARIICTTLIGCSDRSINHLRFSTCVIDEASQALEPACWNAILRSDRTFLVGDHKQLPPVVKSDKAKELKLDKTLLDHLSEVAHFNFLLDVQYRMHEDILKFSNKRHYENKLLSHIDNRNRTLPEDKKVVQFIDTSGCGFYEEQNPKKKSYHNSQEYFLLREYILTQKEKQLPYSIGIISPYANQVSFIRNEVAGDQELEGMDIEVDTIDGFQGQEKDIIYISLVRSNDQGNVGFLADARRLNVAMTRAKMKLVLIGDLSTLVQNSLFRDLADFIEENDFYKSAWEYMSY